MDKRAFVHPNTSRHSHSNSWSSDGCSVTFASPGVTSCLCNHTTNFAVVMNYLEPKVSFFKIGVTEIQNKSSQLNTKSVVKRYNAFKVTDFSLIFPSVTVESRGGANSVQADFHRLRSVAVCARSHLNDVHRLRVSDFYDIYIAGKRTCSSGPTLYSHQC